MNYYISDLHLGHANIIRFCDRPFADVEEMNRMLIDSWNARVHRDDHVYIIGDFAFRSESNVSEYLDQLEGRKHLIVGNHDGKWMRTTDLDKYFESVDLMLEINDGKRMLIMCHYPMMTWPGSKSFHIYGHIHNNTNDSYWPLLCKYDRALNASVEINGYQPVTFEELVANNERWKREVSIGAIRETQEAFASADHDFGYEDVEDIAADIMNDRYGE